MAEPGSTGIGCESLDEEDHVSLCEVLDRVLNKGAVVQGDIMISVADVDLLYLELRVILTSIETALRAGLAGRGMNRFHHGDTEAH